ncbi:MAG: peptidylprolyl isomerase [Marinilabiliales bacterium]|nr:MAG: peptidylprolyl isomerase [Marinilabiliales bacterium]
MFKFKISIQVLILLLVITSCTKTKNPKIIMQTEYGDIIIELYAEKAPITVANFLKYIDENRFTDASFYRAVRMDNQPDNDIKIEVIQGGLFEDEHPEMRAAIQHESTKQTGILHTDGVISMARNEPGSATSEFFICIGDQPSLDYGGMRNADGQGFAAFGKVIKGLEVVKKIQSRPAKNQYLEPHIKINQIKRMK